MTAERERLTQAEIDTVIRCRYVAGEAPGTIRESLGLPFGYVGRRLMELGLPPRDDDGALRWGERILPLSGEKPVSRIFDDCIDVTALPLGQAAAGVCDVSGTCV